MPGEPDEDKANRVPNLATSSSASSATVDDTLTKGLPDKPFPYLLSSSLNALQSSQFPFTGTSGYCAPLESLKN